MIRWYDYVVAVIAADFITSFLFAGFVAVTWWHPLFYGFVAGMTLQFWTHDYCTFRLRQEIKRGE